MKVEIVPIEQAKAQARASRISSEQEVQITDMLKNLTKDDGARITMDEGERVWEASNPAFRRLRKWKE